MLQQLMQAWLLTCRQAGVTWAPKACTAGVFLWRLIKFVWLDILAEAPLLQLVCVLHLVYSLFSQSESRP